ncbi:MAG: serine acetyltransferase [Clostridia bacterium]|nr:serine acetyltransferase [Clostridia bacterium]
MNEKADRIIDAILTDYDRQREIDRLDMFGQPDQEIVNEIIQNLLMILYPGFYRDRSFREHSAKNRLAVLIDETMYLLRKQIEIVLVNQQRYQCLAKQERKTAAQELCLEFFSHIPEIRSYLDTDIDAAFDGDPAANDKIEIVIAYPGLYAITIYRLAHELYRLNVPYIPRMMSEYAHSQTGVDIHPGATIGKYFFIDHATGIVIGETSEIGEHVKVYQGVTIGALSTKDGQALHGKKRHPTIEDHVTLYAGCAVLGGKTVIGHDSVIGGSAFVTDSVPPYSRVSVKVESAVYSGATEPEYQI